MIRVDEPFLPINHPFRRTYNLKQVLAKYNHPERKLKTYSVVGTNGKGSTSFYLSQVLQQTHPKVGLFVSPAFQYQNERIQINDQPISDDDLRYYRDLIAQDIIDYDLTFFEIWTLIAILYFHNQGIEVVVMEAGIGGLLDATNVMTNQAAVLLTAVDYDHTEILGARIEEILANKIRIIKPGATLFISADNQKYREPIEAIIRHLGFPIVVVWADKLPDAIFYQQGNKGLVKAIADSLGLDSTQSLKLAPPNGRFTILNQDPLVIIDGAHNPQAIRQLIQTYKQSYPQSNPLVLAGFSAHKDYNQSLELLATGLDLPVYATSFQHFKAWHLDQVNWNLKANDWKQFLEDALEKRQDVLITGSLYFIPLVAQWFNQRK